MGSSSLTRDQTSPPALEAYCPSHWTTSEVPSFYQRLQRCKVSLYIRSPERPFALLLYRVVLSGRGGDGGAGRGGPAGAPAGPAQACRSRHSRQTSQCQAQGLHSPVRHRHLELRCHEHTPAELCLTQPFCTWNTGLKRDSACSTR